MENKSVGLKTKTIVLFFTYGVSLDLWEKRGLLERELKLYERLGKYFGKIYFITYGRNDGRFQEKLTPLNIAILPKKFWCPNLIYSLLIPFIFRKELCVSDFYKTNQMLGSWSAVIARWRYSKKLIARTGYTLSIFAKKDNYFKYCLARLAELLVLKNCALFIVATAKEEEYFHKYQDKIAVVPNFVDTDLFKPSPELRDKNEKTTLLFIGRLAAQKNLENLFLALKDLPNIRLQIIGSGEQENKLRDLARELNLEVDFLGNIAHEQLPKYISAADIFVLPSLYEGNPKVLLEAFAGGAVVLATDVAGINNIVQSGVNGYLTGTHSAQLRAGLKSLLADPSLGACLRLAARRAAVENFSLDKIESQELQNYV